MYVLIVNFPGGSDSKASVYNAGDLGSIPGFDPWVGKIPWRRKWQPTPVFWPGESHGLYSPWGYKESDTPEQLSPERLVGCRSRGVAAGERRRKTHAVRGDRWTDGQTELTVVW